ncbi:group II intron reverse transcriptase/maturase [Candidatus Phytoplasma ziziphi]|uniref:group II intron reverse transcriptase/maturase n=1 Tax=Candidatus Phytoplasma TaxID=33926 RepID=UPI001EED2867
MSTINSKNEFKLSRTLKRIQIKALNNQTLKKELQHGMNNLLNTQIAFNQVASNTGAGTSGIDNKTIDAISLKKMEKYHMEYVNNRYEPKPIRRVNIPKKNGKTRPLGIPIIQDRITQKAMEQLLTPYYENIFSEWSFGFRPKKSCLDAIKRIKQRFQGIDYLIKIDIKGYFDTIDHDILLKMLNKHIRKNKALTTITKWLKADVKEKGMTYNTSKGSPQGGIISPLLANVYLHYIDQKMENLIKEGIPQRRTNSEYARLRYKGSRNINVDRRINLNPNPRVEYIRYADDFIIGIKGERDKADKIKQLITKWLEEDLNLEISKDKTKIIKANKGTKFLSYMIKIYPTNQNRLKKTAKNSLNGKVQIQIPKITSKEYGKEHGWLKGKEIMHDKGLISRDELEIIRTYKAIINGIIQYFCLANNLAQLTYLAYIAEYTCLKTLAGKKKTSIARVRKKYQLGKTWEIEYDNQGKLKKETWLTYDWNRMKGMRKFKGKPDKNPNPNFLKGRTSLIKRLQAQKCEICHKKDVKLEIHHTKTVRDANWRSVRDKKNDRTVQKMP